MRKSSIYPRISDHRPESSRCNPSADPGLGTLSASSHWLLSSVAPLTEHFSPIWLEYAICKFCRLSALFIRISCLILFYNVINMHTLSIWSLVLKDVFFAAWASLVLVHLVIQRCGGGWQWAGGRVFIDWHISSRSMFPLPSGFGIKYTVMLHLAVSCNHWTDPYSCPER